MELTTENEYYSIYAIKDMVVVFFLSLSIF